MTSPMWAEGNERHRRPLWHPWLRINRTRHTFASWTVQRGATPPGVRQTLSADTASRSVAAPIKYDACDQFPQLEEQRTHAQTDRLVLVSASRGSAPSR